MDKNHEKFRKWLEIAKKTRRNSPLTFSRIPTDDYLKAEVRLGAEDYWLYFGKETASDCQKTDEPNVWIQINDNDTISIGLAFNANNSVNKAENILRGYARGVKEQLFKHFKGESGWWAVIQIRQKFHNFSESPIYEERKRVPINELNEDKVEELFSDAKNIIKEYSERTKLPLDDPKYLCVGGGASFNLLEKEIPATEQAFEEAFAFAHDSLLICLKVKTPAEHNREQNKRYTALKCKEKTCSHKCYDPKNYDKPYCDFDGGSLEKVQLTKDEWINEFGYPPNDSK